VHVSNLVKCGPETRNACPSIVKLLEMGTEDDVLRVENHLSFRPVYAERPEWVGDPTPISDSMFRKLKHQVSTEH